MPEHPRQQDICDDADPRWPCLRDSGSYRCSYHLPRYERYMGRLYTWRVQYKNGQRKKPPPSATEWIRRYRPDPIRPYLALTPAEVEQLDDLLISAEQALIATLNLPDLPPEVAVLQQRLTDLANQLNKWLIKPGA